jgi:hypothetical protein
MPSRKVKSGLTATLRELTKLREQARRGELRLTRAQISALRKKVGSEIRHVQAQAKAAALALKQHFQAVTEAERAKRRARSSGR